MCQTGFWLLGARYQKLFMTIFYTKQICGVFLFIYLLFFFFFNFELSFNTVLCFIKLLQQFYMKFIVFVDNEQQIN